jgi:hypothetical protein
MTQEGYALIGLTAILALVVSFVMLSVVRFSYGV